MPWIIHWPAVVAPGGVSSQHCMTMDWTVTMLAAAGVPMQGVEQEGVSLLPVLSGGPLFHRPLYWRMKHRGQRAMRDGRWKYLRVDGHDYLFDLDADERERANLATALPQKLADMRQAWERWNATMPPIPPEAAVLPGYTAADMPQR